MAAGRGAFVESFLYGEAVPRRGAIPAQHRGLREQRPKRPVPPAPGGGKHRAVSRGRPKGDA